VADACLSALNEDASARSPHVARIVYGTGGESAPGMSMCIRPQGRPDANSNEAEANQMSDDVSRWPDDPETAAVLQSYLADPDSMMSGSQSDFRGADLRGLDLSGAELIEANLREVSLSGTDLTRVNLRIADLSGADLTGARMYKTDADHCVAAAAVLRGAYLFRASFMHADLRSADLRRAFLNAVNFAHADMRGADLRKASVGKGTPLFFRETRLLGSRLEGAQGQVRGTVDIGEDAPEILAGAELTGWFRSQNAECTVVP
jgi:pentapeptide repeat protein